jgi:hypothetical protein
MTNISEVRVAIFREGEFWIAQCIDHDVGVQAGDLLDLEDRLMLALEAERKESLARNGEAFSGIGPAPKFFQDMWEQHCGTYHPRVPSDLSPLDIHCTMVIVA